MIWYLQAPDHLQILHVLQTQCWLCHNHLVKMIIIALCKELFVFPHNYIHAPVFLCDCGRSFESRWDGLNIECISTLQNKHQVTPICVITYSLLVASLLVNKHHWLWQSTLPSLLQITKPPITGMEIKFAAITQTVIMVMKPITGWKSTSPFLQQSAGSLEWKSWLQIQLICKSIHRKK